jgi:trigger factor
MSADVQVKVNSVKVKELPVLDDEFAQSASEFDTIGELRAGTRKQLEQMRRAGQAGQARERTLDAILQQVDMPLPEKVLESEVEGRKQSLQSRLQRAGMTLDAYLEGSGQSAEELEVEFANEARRSVKAGFILDKVAVDEELGIETDELNAYLTEQAYRMGVPPEQLAQQLDQNQINAMAADVLRSKALTLITERAKVTDETGRTVDVTAAYGGAEAEDGDDSGADEAGDAAEDGASGEDAEQA